MTSLSRHHTSFTRTEIADLFKRARRVYRDNGIEIRSAKGTHPFGRILLIVPRAVGSAVVRNKLKRRIKALFHEHNLSELVYDTIILTKKPAGSYSFQQLAEIVIPVFNALKMDPNSAH